MSWEIQDLRGGIIVTDNPKAQLCGRSWEAKDKVLWLAENQDFADDVEQNGLAVIWIDHGPYAVRVLADYAAHLEGHQIAVLERSDPVGEQFAELASAILSQFAIVRRVQYPQNTDLESWLRGHSQNQLKQKLLSLSVIENAVLPRREELPMAYRALDACGARFLPDKRLALWKDLITDDLYALMEFEYPDWEPLTEFARLEDLPDDEAHHNFLTRYSAKRKKDETLDRYLKRVCA